MQVRVDLAPKQSVQMLVQYLLDPFGSLTCSYQELFFFVVDVPIYYIVIFVGILV